MDRAGVRLGYMLGISEDRRPYEYPSRTNQGDFQGLIPTEGGYYAIGSRLPRERRSRLAGDAFNLNLIGSTGNPPLLPAPYVGGAELRNLDVII